MGDLIRQFGLDWKLLLAQVVNFFILLFLLQRFAYKPIIGMLNERKKKIEEGLEASEASKKRLAEAETTKQAILLKAEEEAVGIVSKSEVTAQHQAHAIIAKAQTTSEHIIASGEKKLAEDQRALEEKVKREAEAFIKQGLRATIGRMNPTERDEMLIKEALRELSTLS